MSLGGILQSESSYSWVGGAQTGEGRERVGFGIRRARLLVTAAVGQKAGAFVHLDADGGIFSLLDAYLAYQPSPTLRVRLGRMASAQPRAFILTRVVAMDATERAAIALLWNASTLGSKGRDFGLDVRYLNDVVEAILFVHNGDGSFDGTRGNFQPSIVGDVTGGLERSIRRMAVSAYVAFYPRTLEGVELGAFAGYNGSEGPTTAIDGEGRTYVSYSAHAYWGSEPGSQRVRLKADLIGVRFEELSTLPVQNTLGLAALCAVAIHRAAELFGRAEVYDPDREDSSREFFLAAGASFSLSKLRGGPFSRERLTWAITFAYPTTTRNPRSISWSFRPKSHSDGVLTRATAE